MSAERVATMLGELTDRKGLLKKAGAAGLGSALFMLGSRAPAAEAQVCFQHGCHLCDSCRNPCNPPDWLLTGCSWCWTGACHMNPGGSSWHVTWCCEGYNSTVTVCDGNCRTHDQGWVCSFLGESMPC
jgi:hypothetical protein